MANGGRQSLESRDFAYKISEMKGLWLVRAEQGWGTPHCRCSPAPGDFSYFKDSWFAKKLRHGR